MIYFKLDIPRINKNLDDYVNNKKEFMDSMNLIYGMLYNVDGVWNDNNTENFLQKIKEDKNKIDDYFYNLDKIYKEIGIFKNNIDTICRNSNYKNAYSKTYENKSFSLKNHHEIG